jgi:hypothetical protein
MTEHAGDQRLDWIQRLLNRASWDAAAAQLAMDIYADCRADGLPSASPAATRSTTAAPSCGSCWRSMARAYVLRVASSFILTLAPGTKVTCKEAAKQLLKDTRRREVRSAGRGRRASAGTPGRGSPLPPAPPPARPPPPEDRAGLLLPPHARGPADGQTPIRVAGLCWPVVVVVEEEEDFWPGKDDLGLDQCQARLYPAIARHAVLVMAALAICAVIAPSSGTAPTPRPGHLNCRYWDAL